MLITQLIPCLLATILADAKPATQPAIDYLSDIPYRVLFTKQQWGRLGLNTSAFERGSKPLPLRIGDKNYPKGVGFYAPGEITVELAGEYEQFDAEIGLQPLPDHSGSAVFQVFVDDHKVFESAAIGTGEPAQPISIPVAGAMELRLVATSVDNGPIRDSANWSEARLTRSAVLNLPAEKLLDVAPFAQVITCDPARTTGAQSKRVEEYRAEDVFLETELTPDAHRHYPVPHYPMGQCIGLKWPERRLIRELLVDFEGEIPDKIGMQVQCWIGESLWQGNWKQLNAMVGMTKTGWRIVVDWSKMPEARGGTRKIRLIIPPAQANVVRRFTAITTNRLDTIDLTVQLEKSLAGQHAVLEMYNGQFVDDDRDTIKKDVDLGRPVPLKVRYTKPRPWNRDGTVLRVQLPETAFGIAMDDIIRDGCVYVREADFFIAKQGGPTFEEHKKQIEGKKTILQQVREMPDQTFAQAIEHVHNPKQNLQPMLLSLACDNHKFVIQRDGTILFGTPTPILAGQLPKAMKYPTKMTPKFGSGKNSTLRRHLDDGWLPAPVTEIEDEGVLYTQRTYVIPGSSEQPHPSKPWLDSQPLCVVEFSAKPLDETKASAAHLALTFQGDVEKNAPAEISNLDIRYNGQLLGRASASDANISLHVEKDTLQIGWSSNSWGRVFQIYLFGSPIKSDDKAPERVADPFQVFQQYWTRVMAPVMQIELPDPLLTNVIRASQVHCLLAARNEQDGARVAPWISSDSYGPLESESNSIIRGMDAWGHHEFARRSLDYFIDKYSPNGMLSTGYTLMGMGWHLWTLGEHYQLTQDQEWMKRVAPKVMKACQWIVAQLEKTQGNTQVKPPESGLMPPGVLADWNAYAYYFCLNGYFYKGLLEASRALTAIGLDGAGELTKNANAYRDDILRAYQWTQSRMPVYPLRDGTSVPGYPSQLNAPGPTNNFFPGEDGNRSWCYDVELGAHQLVPQGLLDPTSQSVADLMDHMEDVQFVSSGWYDYPAERNEKDWFNLGGFAKVQPYYCRNIEIDALRDDVKPFIRSYFNTIPSLLGFETLSFQEHFNGIAAWNKTHETGYFLYYSRFMLVQERGDELWLAPFVTSNWLKDGMTISVKNAPTRFGPVSYEIESQVKQARIKATVTWPTRNKPKNIAIRVRHPEGKLIKSVEVQAPNGGKALFHIDSKDGEVIHLEETEPVAQIHINY